MQDIALNDGRTMPAIGFGTYQITDYDECKDSVRAALDMGYRLVDTAQAYGNEEAVGAGIKASGVAREDVFVTTKVWFKAFEAEQAAASVKESLRKLQLDYLDLVLLHWPFGNTYAAYRVLEQLQQEGLVRSIGVSNFAPSQLVDLAHFNNVVPAVNQVETNLLAQQRELHAVMDELGVAHQAYAPFGQGLADEMFDQPAVRDIAAAHGKTPRQVALRFLLQQGIGVIPKSVHAERMRQNADVFDFELSQPEMDTLAGMDTNKPLIGNPQDAQLAKSAMTW